jgi:hypothetical protein
MPRAEPVKSLTIVVHSGGVEVASNGKTVHSAGRQENNPTSQVALFVDGFAGPLAASENIQDPQLRQTVQSNLIGQFQGAVSTLQQAKPASGRSFLNCSEMASYIKTLQDELQRATNAADRAELTRLIESDEKIYDYYCEREEPRPTRA